MSSTTPESVETGSDAALPVSVGPSLDKSDGDTIQESPPEKDEPKLIFSINKQGAETNQPWYAERDTWDGWLDGFKDWEVRGSKDGRAFVPGKMLPGSRGKRNATMVESNHALVYDFDGEMTWEEVYAICDKSGLNFYLYTTYSHRGTRELVQTDQYYKWAEKSKGEFPVSPTRASVESYLKANHRGHLVITGCDPDAYVRVPDKGNAYVAEHQPVDKLRVVFPLAEPIVISRLHALNAECKYIYAEIYMGFARQLGFRVLDESCAQPERCFYFPSRPPGSAPSRGAYQDEGKFLDWKGITRAELPRKANKLKAGGPTRATGGKRSAEPVEHAGRNFGAYCGAYGGSFEIEDALRATAPDDIFRNPRAQGGVHIECPFEAEHSNAGDQGTFVVNASENSDRGFGLHCCHQSCLTQRGNGTAVDRAIFLREMLRLGWLTIEQLEAPELGGGPVPLVRPTKEVIREMVKKLGPVSTSDDWDPVLDALARLSDPSFDAEALGSICEATGKSIKTNLSAALKARRRKVAGERRAEQREAVAGTEQPSVLSFHDYDNENFHAYAERAKRHLAEQNREVPRLFVRGTNIVRVDTDTNTGARQITYCGLQHVRAELNRVTTWSKTTASDMIEGDFRPKYHSCPKDVAEYFHATEAASLALPYLRDVMDTPYFNRDGELVIQDGYDPSSGILLTRTKGLEITVVSEDPTAPEIDRARWLLRELYLDFPFSDGEEVDLGLWQTDRAYRMTIGQAARANQIAKTIQPFVAEMIGGNLMLHLVTKVMRRTGAGYMQDGCGIVCEGSTPAIETLPASEEEVQKRLLTKAMEGEKRIVFDNQREGRPVQSESLASAQTAGRVCGRILGQSRTGSGPWRATVEINGNNLTVHEDIAHRGLWVELNAHRKDPEKRQGFAHDPYQAWVTSRRGEFIWAILTVVRAWIAKGRPMPSDPRVIGGFEDYCRTMGGILEVAGIRGFNSNRDRIRIDAAQVDEVQAFMGFMLEVFGTQEVSVGRCDPHAGADPTRFNSYNEDTLVQLLLDVSGDITLGLFDSPNTASLGSRLGKKLKQYEDRPFEIDGRTFTFQLRTERGITKYRLKPQDGRPVARRHGRMRSAIG
jgi:hypothetical protein